MSGIAFFRAGFLWALGLLAVPVVLHLLNRRRTLRLDFSSLRFFTATAVRANRARTLRRWLQLLARLGTLAAIALLFAGPHDTRDPFAVLTDPACVTLVWVDPTVSMGYVEEGRSCAERGLALVDSLRAILPSSGQTLVYDETARGFVPHAQHGQGPLVRHGPAGIAEMAAALRSRLERRPGAAVLVVVTDLQEPSAAGLDTVFTADTLMCPVLCASVRPRAVRNRGIVDAVLPAENASLVQAAVAAEGKPQDAVNVCAVVGGMRAGRTEVRPVAGDTVQVLVRVPPEAQGAWGAVMLESADGFAADDTCVFLREQFAGRGVLVVGDAKGAYPIAAALAAGGAGYWGKVAVKGPGEVAPDDVEKASLVVLDQVEHATAGVAAALGRAGAQRTAVIYSPALTPAASSLTATLLTRAAPGAAVRMDSLSGGAAPVLADTISPLWSGFPSRTDRTVAVYRMLAGLPGTALLRLDNGAALATRLVDSAGGVVILLATPLGITQANNLCETGFYVPLLDRLARHAVGLASPGSRTWYAGQSYRNPYFGGHAGAAVFDAAGVMTGRWEHQPRVLFERPGAYRVVPDRQPAYWVRVGIDPQERRLVYREPAAPQARARRVAIVPERDVPGFVRQAGRSRVAQTLWLVLALCVLLEMLTWERGPRGMAARDAAGGGTGPEV